MLEYLVRDLDINSQEDAIKMISLFGGMDDAWPGGFLRGAEFTVERMMQELQQTKMLHRLVVEHNGQFVAYTDVSCGEDGGKDIAYIGLLGARLEHHGKGLGKRLLCEVIQRTTGMGFKQITLYTWPGNLKAVPLYKKCGFFWVPDTEVYMRNFLPSVLALPQSKEFFAHTNWYSSLKRDLSLTPDEMLCGKVKVYEYLFEHNNRVLKVTYDAHSFGLTAIETDRYSVACTLEKEEAFPGENCTITWQLRSKTSEHVEATVICNSTSELELQFEEHITFRDTALISKQLTVSEQALPLRNDQTSRYIASTVIIDGEVIQMKAGVHVVRAIDIRSAGIRITPSVPAKISIPIHNQTDSTMRGTVYLIQDDHLNLSKSEFTFDIEPRMGFNCDSSITASTNGVWPCRVICNSDLIRTERTLWYRAGVMNPLAWRDEYADTYHMEYEQSKVSIARFGGGIDLTIAGNTSSSLHQNMASLGPPFHEELVVARPLNIEIIKQEQLVSILTKYDVPNQKGVQVLRESSFLSDGVLRTRIWVVNESAKVLEGQIKIQTNAESSGLLSVPTDNGLLQGVIVEGEFPSEFEDFAANNNNYYENWISTEENGNVSGLIWLGNIEVQPPPYWSRYPALISPLVTVDPGKSVEVGETLLVNKPGNWKTVRDIWKQFQIETEDTEDPKSILVLREFTTFPSPLLTLRNEFQTRITLTIEQYVKHTGSLEVNASRFSIEPSTINFENVNESQSHTVHAQISTEEKLAAEKVAVKFQSGAVVDTLFFTVIKAGDINSSTECVHNENQSMLNNGLIEFVVSPSHLGGITSLQHNGKEYLYSSFPKPHPFRYCNPWYGGIHPYLNESSTDITLTREQFISSPLVIKGSSGLVWTGVKVESELTHKEWRWLKIEVDYLTLPGSNLIAMRSRWINLDAASHQLHGGMAVWSQPDGQKVSNALWAAKGCIVERAPHRFGTNSPDSTWVASENPDSRNALLVISQQNEGGCRMEDWDSDGRCLSSFKEHYLKPGETFETVDWLVLVSSRDEIDAYSTLASIKQLP